MSSCTVCREVFSFGLDVLPKVLLLRKKGVPLDVSLTQEIHQKCLGMVESKGMDRTLPGNQTKAEVAIEIVGKLKF